MEHHSSNSSIASSQGEPPIKTWHSLVQTYKIIMNTLHIKPHMKRPQTKEIVIYVTSVFDQKCFWGQIVEDVSENMAFLYNHKPRPVLGVMFYLIEKYFFHWIKKNVAIVFFGFFQESSLNALSDVMAGLQSSENRIGPTKGLGRCAALYKKEWYR